MAKPTDADYIKLGKQFQTILESNYAVLKPAWPTRIKNAVIHGIFSGIGGVIGATLGIAALIFVLNWFGALPGIGQFFVNIANQLTR